MAAKSKPKKKKKQQTVKHTENKKEKRETEEKREGLINASTSPEADSGRFIPHPSQNTVDLYYPSPIPLICF